MKEKNSLKKALAEMVNFTGEVEKITRSGRLVMIQTNKGFYPIGEDCRLSNLEIKKRLIVLSGENERIRIMPENVVNIYSQEL